MVNAYSAVRQFERFLSCRPDSEDARFIPLNQEDWRQIATVVYDPANQRIRIEKAKDLSDINSD